MNLNKMCHESSSSYDDKKARKPKLKWDYQASNRPYYPGQPVDMWEGGRAIYWRPEGVTKGVQ